METSRMQTKLNWPVILAYYFIACLWSWPLFWWRDAHPASWKALPIPPVFQSPLVSWGPGLAAIVVFLVFPRMRPGFLSLPGSSWKLGFDLIVWGFACLGEELGWRGFLQGALRPLGRIRAGLLLSLMWTAWHFTTTWSGLISHLYTLLPSLAALSFGLAFLTERTGSLA